MIAVPRRRGAEPPYPKFLPSETAWIGWPYLLQALTTAETSSTEAGEI